MKKFLFVSYLLFLALFATAQKYNPVLRGQPIVRPLAPSTPIPIDMRSYFADSAHGVYRPYLSTTEVNNTLNIKLNRVGHFPIFINTGGTLGSDFKIVPGTGITSEYWYKDGTEDSNLVVKNIPTPADITKWNGTASKIITGVLYDSASGEMQIQLFDGTIFRDTIKVPTGSSGGLNNYPLSVTYNPGTFQLSIARQGLTPLYVFLPSSTSADSLQKIPIDTSGRRNGWILGYDSVANKYKLIQNLGGSGGGFTPPGTSAQVLAGDGSLKNSLAQSFVTNLTTDLASKIDQALLTTQAITDSSAVHLSTTEFSQKLVRLTKDSILAQPLDMHANKKYFSILGLKNDSLMLNIDSIAKNDVINITNVLTKGVQVNTGTIQNANILPLITNNARLFFPNGVYNVDSITVNNVSNLEIFGEKGTVFTTTAGKVFNLGGKLPGLHIHNLKLVSTAVSSAWGASAALIHYYAAGTTDSIDVEIDHNYFTAPTADINGIHLVAELGVDYQKFNIHENDFVDLGRFPIEIQNNPISGDTVERYEGVVYKNNIRHFGLTPGPNPLGGGPLACAGISYSGYGHDIFTVENTIDTAAYGSGIVNLGIESTNPRNHFISGNIINGVNMSGIWMTGTREKVGLKIQSNSINITGSDPLAGRGILLGFLMSQTYQTTI